MSCCSTMEWWDLSSHRCFKVRCHVVPQRNVGFYTLTILGHQMS